MLYGPDLLSYWHGSSFRSGLASSAKATERDHRSPHLSDMLLAQARPPAPSVTSGVPIDNACATRQALHRGRLTQHLRTRDPGQIEQAALDQVLADAQVGQLGDRERGVLQQHVGALDVQVHQLHTRRFRPVVSWIARNHRHAAGTAAASTNAGRMRRAARTAGCRVCR